MALNIDYSKNLYDVGPGGRILTGRRAVNAFAKERLENEYYGPSKEAQIASQSTYARYLPAQILGQILSSPIVWQTMPREQLEQLTNQAANSLINPPSVESLFPRSSRGKGENVFSRLLNSFNNNEKSQNAINETPTSGQVGSQNSVARLPTVQPGVYKNPVDLAVPEYNQNGETPSYAQAPQSNNPQSETLKRIAPNIRLPQSFGGVNPVTVAEAEKKALDTAATGETESKIKQWEATENNSTQAATGAIEALNQLDKLKKTYPKLKFYEKGAVGGRVPGFSSSAQEVDTASNAMAEAVSRARQQGHITALDTQRYGGLKPNRAMNKEAFDHLVDFNIGMNKRIIEYPQFINAARQANFTPTQAQALWNYYMVNKPFYDSKTNKINNKNLNSWEEMFTPENISASLSPTFQKWLDKQNGKKPEPEIDSVKNQKEKYGYKIEFRPENEKPVSSKKETKSTSGKKDTYGYTEDDYEFTAKQNNMTVKQVKEYVKNMD